MSEGYCPECRSAVRGGAPICRTCTAPRPEDGWPVDEQLGRLVGGRYRLEKRLAAGGFGTVFLATHVQQGVDLGRVVLKFLHRELAESADIRRRMLTEVRVARELGNPHVVRVLDIDDDEGGVPFQVQEYVAGEGLDHVLARRGRLPPEEAVEVARQIADGLIEAHAKNIVHRDLKPENVRLERATGLVKILDFGVARVAGPHGTATMTAIGTPRYMAPEQILGRPVDGRTDVFALGVMLFELLANEAPIPRQNTELAYLSLNLKEQPQRLRDLLPRCPADLDALVAAMMAKNPDQRPPSMVAVAETLARIAAGHGWALRVPPPPGVGAAAPGFAPALPGSSAAAAAAVAAAATRPAAARRPAVPAPGDAAPAAAVSVAAAEKIAAAATVIQSRAPETSVPAGRSRRGLWTLGAVVVVVTTAVGIVVGRLLVRDSSPGRAPAGESAPSDPPPVSPDPTVPSVVVEPSPVAPAASPDAGAAVVAPSPFADAAAPEVVEPSVDAVGEIAHVPEPSDAARPRADRGRRRDASSADASGRTDAPPQFQKVGGLRPVP